MRDTIDMAREAGFPLMFFEGVTYVSPELERLVALVRADERESIIDLVALYGGPIDLEAAIRERGNT
jgi:hypothetical protein